MSRAGNVDVTATYSAVLDAACCTAQAPVRVTGGVITQGVSEARLSRATPGSGGTSGPWRRVSGPGPWALVNKSEDQREWWIISESSSCHLKLLKTTLLPSMLQSPPHPVMPSSQPMSMPPPPQRDPDQTWRRGVTYLTDPTHFIPCCHRTEPSFVCILHHCKSRMQTLFPPAGPWCWTCRCSGCWWPCSPWRCWWCTWSQMSSLILTSRTYLDSGHMALESTLKMFVWHPFLSHPFQLPLPPSQVCRVPARVCLFPS